MAFLGKYFWGENSVKSTYLADLAVLLGKEENGMIKKGFKGRCQKRQMKKCKDVVRTYGANENLKRRDQMEWVRLMNNIKVSAEEMVLREIIYV